MRTVNELWQQSQNDAEGMRLGYTTQQHYFAALVRADEREACAKLVHDNALACDSGSMLQTYLASNAAAIRARGNT